MIFYVPVKQDKTNDEVIKEDGTHDNEWSLDRGSEDESGERVVHMVCMTLVLIGRRWSHTLEKWLLIKGNYSFVSQIILLSMGI